MTESGYDVLIRGGTVVDRSAATVADIGVVDGRIAAVASSLTGTATKTVDAAGLLVLPGGVDIHTHLDQVSAKGSRTADDFYTGTRSAAHGGTTTVMAFSAQARGESIECAVRRGLESAAQATTNAGVHLIVTDFSGPDAETGLRLAVAEGIVSLKVFLTYDRLRLADKELVSALACARDLGMTVMVHAEHHGMIGYATGQALSSGHVQPTGHLLAHSRNAEAAGVSEIAHLAEYLDMSVYLVHLSSARALEVVREARARGVRLVVETCPHYLFLEEDRLSGPLELAVQSMCSPPLRDGADREALWRALTDGTVDVVASDHAPYRLDAGKLPNGDATVFTECANGIAGVELRMPLMVSEALTTGRLTLPEVVDLCCTRPAEIMGLAPAKGGVAVGGDADLVIWDPEQRWKVSVDDLHDNMDHSAYAGAELTGRPVMVLVDGDVLIDRTAGVDELAPGGGQVLRLAPNTPARDQVSIPAISGAHA
ncbi:dihydropyrimidinase [Mycolicibacterium litorale]|uniref:dihydropyrimidinase n=1 Tax=Mycolicibacterium litorale TaxID=758802 RepID=UPI003CF51D9A